MTKPTHTAPQSGVHVPEQHDAQCTIRASEGLHLQQEHSVVGADERQAIDVQRRGGGGGLHPHIVRSGVDTSRGGLVQDPLGGVLNVRKADVASGRRGRGVEPEDTVREDDGERDTTSALHALNIGVELRNGRTRDGPRHRHSPLRLKRVEDRDGGERSDVGVSNATSIEIIRRTHNILVFMNTYLVSPVLPT